MNDLQKYFQPFMDSDTITLPIMDVIWTTHSIFFENTIQKEKKRASGCIHLKQSNDQSYDIVWLYKKMMEKLLFKQKESMIKIKKEQLQWIIDNSDDPGELRLAKEKLFALQEQAQLKKEITNLKIQSKKLLFEYDKACRKAKTYDFYTQKSTTDPSQYKKRQDILSRFLMSAQRFVEIKTNKVLIRRCCNDMEIINDEGFIHCVYCNTEFNNVDHSGTWNDKNQSIPIKHHKKEHNVKHFNAATKKIQGTHKKDIPPFVFDLIKIYMEHHELALHNFTIFDLMECLERNSSLSKYYKDNYLIYRIMTGKQIIDLSDVEPMLPVWYKQQNKLSTTIKLKSTSKSSVNTYYILCRLAQLKGNRTDLDLDYFFCAKNESTIKKYDACFEKRCYVLGWLEKGTSISKFDKKKKVK